MPIDSHLPQADPFSLVPTFKDATLLRYTISASWNTKLLLKREITIFFTLQYMEIMVTCLGFGFNFPARMAQYTAEPVSTDKKEVTQQEKSTLKKKYHLHIHTLYIFNILLLF
jgi:hypothetical protein